MKQNAWIIGAGKFGQLAVNRLKNKYRITLVDPDPTALELIKVPGVEKKCRDGIQFLDDCLEQNGDVAWIVPCLPVHLVWEWCRETLGRDRLIPIEPPKGLNMVLPNLMQTDAMHLYTSHADFLCPDHCGEPAEHCTVTGKKRKKDMFAMINDVSIKGYTPLVVQSYQLAPGVGGYSPSTMFRLKKQVSSCKNRMLVATACRCHGVVTAGQLVT